VKGEEIFYDAKGTEVNSSHGLKISRSFIDTTFEILFRTSLDGKILLVNRLFLQHFEFFDRAAIKESWLKDLFEDPSHYQTVLEKLSSQKRISSEKIFFRRKDGQRITSLVNAILFRDGNGSSIINWTALNISGQVESESALQSRNDELRKVNRQMEKFLYSTSHDLRSPLTSILGLVNIIRMENRDPIIQDYVSKIEGSTLKLDKIIKDIMSFSRTTYQRAKSERICFEGLVWKSINNHRNNPNSGKVKCEVETIGESPFFSDTERIEIILDNIIGNCIHFCDVNKARPFVKVNITIEMEQVMLKIIDNGIGIGRQHLDHIFDMFYKASHLSKGAGLGLFIVKETLEKLHGTIHFESEIGFGTLITICIPNDHKGRLINRKLELQNHS
jgi:PAS domain S-box-containing protein